MFKDVENLLVQLRRDNKSIGSIKISLQDILNKLVPEIEEVESLFYGEFCRKYGENSATAGFRQYQAQFQQDFPAADLDEARELLVCIKDLQKNLENPLLFANIFQSLLLVGPVGVGKTHSLVSFTKRRVEKGAWSLVLFGEDFGEQDAWKTIRAKLGFGNNIGREELFECLEAAATHSRVPSLGLLP